MGRKKKTNIKRKRETPLSGRVEENRLPVILKSCISKRERVPRKKKRLNFDKRNLDPIFFL